MTVTLRLGALLFFIVFRFETISGHRFRCITPLSGRHCYCDTEEELIDCHNLGLTEFPRIKFRTPGYSILSLFDNDLSGEFPTEEELKRVMPDIELIDLEDNYRLNCTEISHTYRQIRIISDCVDGKVAPKIVVKKPRSDSAPSEAENDSCGNIWCKIEEAVKPKLTHAFTDVKDKLTEAKEHVEKHVPQITKKIEKFWNDLFG